MNFNNLTLKNTNFILTVTINRESKMNALNLETIEELNKVFTSIYTDNNVKAVILTGSGSKAFVAGADIAEMSELNYEKGKKFSERGQETFMLIEKCPKPVIAAVNGFALGGGCEIAMACHMRIASENAKFGQPEVNLGLIPGFGGTQRMTQLIGKGKAYELMMTSDMIGAAEAKTLGLVNHVTSIDELLPKSVEILEKINTKAPLAIDKVIQCIHSFYDKTVNGYSNEANLFGKCFDSQDFKEGTRAFVEKRKANFTGK